MLRPVALARKTIGQIRLLRDDPARFGANLEQFTQPARFREKLIDVLTASPLHVRIDGGLAAQPALNVLQLIVLMN